MDILEEMDKFIATYNFLKLGRNRQSEQNLSLLVKLNLQLKIKTPRKNFRPRWLHKGILPNNTEKLISSVLAWRILGMGEPSGLLSMGSHRVGHNWSDLAAAAAASFLNCCRKLKSREDSQSYLQSNYYLDTRQRHYEKWKIAVQYSWWK